MEFHCSLAAVQKALKRLKITRKKTRHHQEQDYDQVAAYKYEIADVKPETIAYVDGTGIDQYLYRAYGYSSGGELVHGLIRGRRYARVGIVVAMMGDEVIAPCCYKGTMNHVMFEYWFKHKLLPTLPKGTVIVMDNASFHRKSRLYRLAQKHHCSLIFLSP